MRGVRRPYTTSPLVSSVVVASGPPVPPASRPRHAGDGWPRKRYLIYTRSGWDKDRPLTEGQSGPRDHRDGFVPGRYPAFHCHSARLCWNRHHGRIGAPLREYNECGESGDGEEVRFAGTGPLFLPDELVVLRKVGLK